MTLAVSMPAPFITGVFPGNEANGAKTIAQLETLMLPGETIALATGGENGGALFTDKRLIIVNEAGLFSKRSVVNFIKAASITAVSIDASSYLEVKLAGEGFGGAHLFFDADQDAAKISHWCAAAMAA